MTIRRYETLGTVCTASRVRPEKSGQLSTTKINTIMTELEIRGIAFEDICEILKNLGERREVSPIAENILDDVVVDIMTSADEDFSQDDTRIAMRRVLYKRLHIE